MTWDHQIFTIGHSNHSPKNFLSLLESHRIEAVVDVRSAPYSGYAPQFSYDALKDLLERRQIDYLFLGGELGGRPRDQSCYDDAGRVQYDRVSETHSFEDGFRHVIRRAEDGPIVLMCTEKEPLECHRTLLVARCLSESGVDVQHILFDGRLESHDAAMNRLLEIFQLPPNGDLFRSRADVIVEALARQAQKVAYVERSTQVTRDVWEDAF